MAKLAVIKTKETKASVKDFIAAVTDDQKRKDSAALLKLMEKVAGEKAKMWGASIIGFGNLIYKSPNTTREVEWFKIGFSPRKANITIYMVSNIKLLEAPLKKLGKHKIGGGCLYINKLSDIDTTVLADMLTSVMKKESGVK